MSRRAKLWARFVARASLGAVVVVPLVGSCAGHIEGTIDPRELVVGEIDEESESASAFLRDVVDAVNGRSCAVHPMLLSRERIYDAETEESLRMLGDLAARLCDAGIGGVEAGFDAEGRVEVFGTDTGTLRAGRELFVFGDFEEVTTSARPTVAGSQVACDGFVSPEPELVVHPFDTESFYLQASERLDFVMITDEYGNERCVSSTSYISLNDDSPEYEVYVGWYETPPTETELIVSTEVGSSAASLVWTPSNDHNISVNVSNAVESASSRNYNCSGYIASAPTVSVYVPDDFYGGIRVTSSSDPVLYVVGPDGREFCNDDYSGLNPEIWATWTAGTWDIYVGAFSSGNSFSATLYLE